MAKTYPWKQAVVTGILSALFATFTFSIVDGLKQHFGWNVNPATIRWLTGLLTLVILAIGIYAGMQNVKKTNGGRLSYGRALACGVLIGLTVGVIMAILGYIYTQYINPGYQAYMVAEGMKTLIAEGKNPAEIAAGVSDLQKQFSPGIQVMQALVAQTMVGTIISLIMGAFVRTK